MLTGMKCCPIQCGACQLYSSRCLYLSALQGALRGRTYLQPPIRRQGNGRVTVQFGCCYNYATDLEGRLPGEHSLDPEAKADMHMFLTCQSHNAGTAALPVTCNWSRAANQPRPGCQHAIMMQLLHLQRLFAESSSLQREPAGMQLFHALSLC